MLEVLSKPLGEITTADIQSLIDEKVPEGERIEFKRGLPVAKGETDPWMDGRDEIHDYAKKKILEEVVAFANAYGGVLLIGIEESKTKPSFAAKISPVPRCPDLAERLKLVFRDCVDPKFVRVDIDSILAKDRCECNDECVCGVVIIRVGKSRLAPHQVRFKKTRTCTIRRADRCEEMAMREIQDMTLNVSRGLERLDKRLLERSERFQEEFDRLESHKNAFGIRLTAAPVVDEVGFDDVFQQGNMILVEGLNMPKTTVFREAPDARGVPKTRQELNTPSSFPPGAWRPLLRGARADSATPHGAPAGEYRPLPLSFNYLELYSDGLIELGDVSTTDIETFLLGPDWPIAMFANLAVWADHIRKQAGAPTVEYALEVETRSLGNKGRVETSRYGQANSISEVPNAKFPRYPLNDSGGIAKLLTLFHRDFWHSMRIHRRAEEYTLSVGES